MSIDLLVSTHTWTWAKLVNGKSQYFLITCICVVVSSIVRLRFSLLEASKKHQPFIRLSLFSFQAKFDDKIEHGWGVSGRIWRVCLDAQNKLFSSYWCYSKLFKLILSISLIKLDSCSVCVFKVPKITGWVMIKKSLTN